MKGWLGYFPGNATCKKSNKIETFVQVVTELPAPAVMTAHLVAAKVLRKYLQVATVELSNLDFDVMKPNRTDFRWSINLFK